MVGRVMLGIGIVVMRVLGARMLVPRRPVVIGLQNVGVLHGCGMRNERVTGVGVTAVRRARQSDRYREYDNEAKDDLASKPLHMRRKFLQRDDEPHTDIIVAEFEQVSLAGERSVFTR